MALKVLLTVETASVMPVLQALGAMQNVLEMANASPTLRVDYQNALALPGGEGTYAMYQDVLVRVKIVVAMETATQVLDSVFATQDGVGKDVKCLTAQENLTAMIMVCVEYLIHSQ